jgi:hypothetical protein
VADGSRRCALQIAFLAQRYAAYAQTTEHPVPFDEFAKIMKMMST